MAAVIEVTGYKQRKIRRYNFKCFERPQTSWLQDPHDMFRSRTLLEIVTIKNCARSSYAYTCQFDFIFISLPKKIVIFYENLQQQIEVSISCRFLRTDVDTIAFAVTIV